MIPEFMAARAGLALEHVTDVRAQQIARVYAEAALNAAAKSQEEERVLEELESLQAEVFDKQPNVATLFKSSAINRSAKEAMIRKAFGAGASPVFLNLLLTLNRHDRLSLVTDVRDVYRQLYNARMQRVTVQVRTAAPLAGDQRDQLVTFLRESTGYEPMLDEKVVPELLGGMVIRLGDTLFDGSVRAELLEIRNQLLEKSSHEIQSRRDHFSSAS